MSAETGKRNPDRMNMIGVVVVGICGAVLVYVSIALLQAYYITDTAAVETMADYGGQDLTHRGIKSQQVGNIDPTQGVRNPGADTYSIKIDRAIDLVVEEAKTDASNLVPSQGKSTKPTVQPVYGRPKALDEVKPAPAPGAGSGSGADSGAPPAQTPPGPSAPTGGGAPPPPAPAGGSGASAGSGARAP
jgi:hypothetical protein